VETTDTESHSSKPENHKCPGPGTKTALLLRMESSKAAVKKRGRSSKLKHKERSVKKKEREKNNLRNKRKNSTLNTSQVWWCLSIIPALERLRREDQEFQASLDYTARQNKKLNRTTIGLSILYSKELKAGFQREIGTAAMIVAKLVKIVKS
jgi:hypothetical protein